MMSACTCVSLSHLETKLLVQYSFDSHTSIICKTCNVALCTICLCNMHSQTHSLRPEYTLQPTIWLWCESGISSHIQGTYTQFWVHKAKAHHYTVNLIVTQIQKLQLIQKGQKVRQGLDLVVSQTDFLDTTSCCQCVARPWFMLDWVLFVYHLNKSGSGITTVASRIATI